MGGAQGALQSMKKGRRLHAQSDSDRLTRVIFAWGRRGIKSSGKLKAGLHAECDSDLLTQVSFLIGPTGPYNLMKKGAEFVEGPPLDPKMKNLIQWWGA